MQRSGPQNALGVTPLEYQTARELSSDANVSEDDAPAYWQVVRYYRGQLFDRAEVERALRMLRGT